MASLGDSQLVVTDNEVPSEVDGLREVHYPNRGVDLREATVNFSAIDLLISASTGPMQVCGALGVPTVSLFCPLPACEPERWRPLGNQAVIVMPEAGFCQHQCPADPRACDFLGTGGISVEKATDAVMRTLAPG